MLSVESLHVSYGQIAAVQGASLYVDEGEVVGMVGPNGAGKTTTLMTIMGVLKPRAGEIRFEGRSLLGNRPEKIARQGLSLVPEGRRIFASLTVRENLLVGIASRTDRSVAQSEIDSVVERFPVLKRYLHNPAGRLSGGEQQQLAIARALLSRPRLLLLDEPSLGLAPRIIDVLFDLLLSLRREGMTILLVEQNASRAVQVADRSYVLRSGRVELEGTREDLLQRADFRAAYFGI